MQQQRPQSPVSFQMPQKETRSPTEESKNPLDDKQIIVGMADRIDKLQNSLVEQAQQYQNLLESKSDLEYHYKIQLQDASEQIDNYKNALIDKKKLVSQMKANLKQQNQPVSLEFIHFQNTAAEIQDHEEDDIESPAHESEMKRYILQERKYKTELQRKDKIIEALQSEEQGSSYSKNFVELQEKLKKLSDLLEERKEMVNAQSQRINYLQMNNGYLKQELRKFEENKNQEQNQINEEGEREKIWSEIFQHSQTSIPEKHLLNQEGLYKKVVFLLAEVEHRDAQIERLKSIVSKYDNQEALSQSKEPKFQVKQLYRQFTTVDRVISLINTLSNNSLYSKIYEQNRVILAVLDEYSGFYKQFDQLNTQQNEPKWTQILQFVQSLFPSNQEQKVTFQNNSRIPGQIQSSIQTPKKMIPSQSYHTISPPARVIQKSLTPNKLNNMGRRSLNPPIMKREDTQNFIRSLGTVGYPYTAPSSHIGSRLSQMNYPNFPQTSQPMTNSIYQGRQPYARIGQTRSNSPLPNSFNLLMHLLQTLQNQVLSFPNSSIVNQQINALSKLLQMKWQELRIFQSNDYSIKPNLQNVTITPVYVNSLIQPQQQQLPQFLQPNTSSQEVSIDRNSQLVQKLEELTKQIEQLQIRLTNFWNQDQESAKLISDLRVTVEQLRIDYNHVIKLEEQTDDYLREINRLNFEIQKLEQTTNTLKQQNVRLQNSAEKQKTQQQQDSQTNLELRNKLRDQQNLMIKNNQGTKLLNDQIKYLTDQFQQSQNNAHQQAKDNERMIYEARTFVQVKEESEQLKKQVHGLQHQLENTKKSLNSQISSSMETYQSEMKKWAQKFNDAKTREKEAVIHSEFQNKSISELQHRLQKVETIKQSEIQAQKQILSQKQKNSDQEKLLTTLSLNYQTEISRITSLYNDLQKQQSLKNQDHYNNLEQLQIALTNKLSEIEKLHISLKSKEREITDLQAETKTIKAQKDYQQKENASLRQNLQSLTETSSKKIQDLEVETSKIPQISQMRIQLEKQNEAYKKELNVKKNLAESQRKEIEKLLEDIIQWRNEYTKLDARHKDLVRNHDQQIIVFQKDRTSMIQNYQVTNKTFEQNLNITMSQNLLMEKEIVSLQDQIGQRCQEIEFQKQKQFNISQESFYDLEKKIRLELQNISIYSSQQENVNQNLNKELERFSIFCLERDQEISELKENQKKCQESEQNSMNKNLNNVQKLKTTLQLERTQAQNDKNQYMETFSQFENQVANLQEIIRGMDTNQKLNQHDLQKQYLADTEEYKNKINHFQKNIQEYQEKLSFNQKDMDYLNVQIIETRQKYLSQQQKNKQIVEDYEQDTESISKKYQQILNGLQQDKELLQSSVKELQSKLTEQQSSDRGQFEQEKSEQGKYKHEDEISKLGSTQSKLQDRLQETMQQLDYYQNNNSQLDNQLKLQQQLSEKEQQSYIKQIEYYENSQNELKELIERLQKEIQNILTDNYRFKNVQEDLQLERNFFQEEVRKLTRKINEQQSSTLHVSQHVPAEPHVLRISELKKQIQVLAEKLAEETKQKNYWQQSSTNLNQVREVVEKQTTIKEIDVSVIQQLKEQILNNEQEISSLKQTINQLRTNQNIVEGNYIQQGTTKSFVTTEVTVTRESFHNGQYSVSQEKYSKEEEPKQILEQQYTLETDQGSDYQGENLEVQMKSKIYELEIEQHIIQIEDDKKKFQDQSKIYQNQIKQMREQIIDYEHEVSYFSTRQSTLYNELESTKEQLKNSLNKTQNVLQMNEHLEILINESDQKIQGLQVSLEFFKSELQSYQHSQDNHFQIPGKDMKPKDLIMKYEELRVLYLQSKSFIVQLQDKITDFDSEMNKANIEKDMMRVEIGKLRTQTYRSQNIQQRDPNSPRFISEDEGNTSGSRMYDNVDYKIGDPQQRESKESKLSNRQIGQSDSNRRSKTNDPVVQITLLEQDILYLENKVQELDRINNYHLQNEVQLEDQLKEWKHRYEQTQTKYNEINNQYETRIIFQQESQANYSKKDMLIEELHQLKCLNQELRLKVSTLQDENLSLSRQKSRRDSMQSSKEQLDMIEQYKDQVKYLQAQLNQMNDISISQKIELSRLNSAKKESLSLSGMVYEQQSQGENEVEIINEQIQQLRNSQPDEVLFRLALIKLYEVNVDDLSRRIQDLKVQILFKQKSQTYYNQMNIENLIEAFQKQIDNLKVVNNKLNDQVSMFQDQNQIYRQKNLESNNQIRFLSENLSQCQKLLDERQKDYLQIMQNVNQQTMRSQYE